MAKLIIDSEGLDNKANIFMEGMPQELILAIVMAMSASPFLARILEVSTQAYNVSVKKGIDPKLDTTITLDEEADKLHEQLMNKGKEAKK